MGSTGTHLQYNPSTSIATTDYIKENEQEFVSEISDYLDLTNVGGYVVIYPTFRGKEQYLKSKGAELADEHAQTLMADQNLYARVKAGGGNEVVELVEESKKCITQDMYRPAIASLSVAMEEAFVIALGNEGRNIKKEEKDGNFYSLFNLIKISHEDYGLISQKSFERAKIINKIRRFGTHHKSGKTLKEDADFVLRTVEQLLDELF